MKFKLLKDLPDIKAGAIFEQKNDAGYVYWNQDTQQSRKYGHTYVENNPEWFKKVEEPEFKAGNYITAIKGSFGTTKVRRISDCKICLDFLKWSENGGSLIHSWELDNIRLATTEEIEKHLIAEAEKRGYKGRITIKSLETGQKWTTDISKGLFYDAKEDELNVKSLLGFKAECSLYIKGRWAEIVKDEPIKINGYELQLEGNKIWFGNKCAKFTTHQFYNLKSAINSFNSGGEWSNRKIKSINLDSGVTIDTETINKIVERIK